jgi:Flp pilus assembly protein TadD
MTTDRVAATLPVSRAPDAPTGQTYRGCEPAARRRALLFRTIPVTAALLGGIAYGVVRWFRHDTRPVADLRTIETWIENREFGRAEKELHKHVRLAPHDTSPRMMLARVLAAQGDLAGCTRELHQVPTVWPRKAEGLYREGQAYLLMNRARDAEAALLAVIDAAPLHPVDPAVFHDASQELLSLYATEDRWDDAHVILWKLYDRATPAYRPTLLAMRIHSELERVAPSESVKLLSRYVAADPTDWQARRALANAELALGQHTEALRDIRECLKNRHDDPRVWRDYLNMLELLGETETLSAVLAQVPAIAETEPDLWILRGEARERAGEWAAAASHFRRALELKPNLPGAHYRLAIIERRLGNSSQAAAHRARWQEMLEARSELHDAFNAYVDAQRRLADDSPELVASLQRLAWICRTLGWLRAAEGWSRLALGR